MVPHYCSTYSNILRRFSWTSKKSWRNISAQHAALSSIWEHIARYPHTNVVLFVLRFRQIHSNHWFPYQDPSMLILGKKPWTYFKSARYRNCTRNSAWIDGNLNTDRQRLQIEFGNRYGSCRSPDNVGGFVQGALNACHSMSSAVWLSIKGMCCVHHIKLWWWVGSGSTECDCGICVLPQRQVRQFHFRALRLYRHGQLLSPERSLKPHRTYALTWSWPPLNQ